jgi:hypothetical protein
LPHRAPSTHDYTPDPNLVFYGCAAHIPAHDITAMGSQDRETGLWSPGRQRVHQRCSRCGGRVRSNEHCGPCARTGRRFRGPEVIVGAPAKEFHRPNTAGPDLTIAERLAVKLGRKPTRKELRRFKAELARKGEVTA